MKWPLKEATDCFRCESVALKNARVVAMTAGIGQIGEAEIVGTLNDLNILICLSDTADHLLEVGNEGGAVPLADEGQHAEQVVRPKLDGHGSWTAGFERRLRTHHIVAVARNALIRAPIQNGVKPKRTARCQPTTAASHRTPSDRLMAFPASMERAEAAMLRSSLRSASQPTKAAATGN